MLPRGLPEDAGEMVLSTMGAAAVSMKGCKGADDASVGQDSFCVAHLHGGWHLSGVFDGHGSNGDWPAARAARALPFLLQQGVCADLLAKGDVEGSLRRAFRMLQSHLVAEATAQKFDLRFNGTTAVVSLRHPDQNFVWIANCGDSRAILIQSDGGVIQETSDHKPSRQDEAERIIAAGGEVVVTDFDGIADHRVNVKGTGYPGLSVSRSLGDGAVKSCGVSAEPDVMCWPTDASRGLYLLACSDGVWEYFSSQEVARLVADTIAHGDSPHAALEVVLGAARAAWVKESEGHGSTYCDDITLVLAPISERHAPCWYEVAIDSIVKHQNCGTPCVVS